MNLLLGFIASFITQILKRFGFEKQGAQLACFIIALIIAIIQIGFKWLPKIYFQTIVGTWAAAVLWYEILLKKIGIFQKLGGTE